MSLTFYVILANIELNHSLAKLGLTSSEAVSTVSGVLYRLAAPSRGDSVLIAIQFTSHYLNPGELRKPGLSHWVT